MSVRSGIGWDSHRLVEGRPLILGGVEIPFELGLTGHSDADVLCHAIIDALLGAACLGDIGEHFPDSDERYAAADSLQLLRLTVAKLAEQGLRPVGIDVTVMMERPKLGGNRAAIAARLREAVGIDQVNVKATTGEGMGFVGRGEGVAALALASVESQLGAGP